MRRSLPPVRDRHAGAMNQPAPQLATPTRTFKQLRSPSGRGARLARMLAVNEPRSWDTPQDLTERAGIVISEPAKARH